MRLCRFLTAFALTLALALPAYAEGEPAFYYVPSAQFSATLQVSEMGFANLTGLFGGATGVFTFDDSTKTISRIKLALEADSLRAATAGQSDNLTGPALLDAARYPEIAFVASKPVRFQDGKAQIAGQLSLHGATKPVTFDATLNRVGRSKYGGGFWDDEGHAVGLSLRATIKRADFAMDGGGDENPFGEDVILTLDMQGLQEQ